MRISLLRLELSVSLSETWRRNQLVLVGNFRVIEEEMGLGGGGASYKWQPLSDYLSTDFELFKLEVRNGLGFDSEFKGIKQKVPRGNPIKIGDLRNMRDTIPFIRLKRYYSLKVKFLGN